MGNWEEKLASHFDYIQKNTDWFCNAETDYKNTLDRSFSRWICRISHSKSQRSSCITRLPDTYIDGLLKLLVICESQRKLFARHIFSFSVVCEMCGTSGSSSTFYSKTKRFCSTSCSRSFSSNSKKSSILARLQVRIQQTVCYHYYFVISEPSFTGLNKSFNHECQKSPTLFPAEAKEHIL